MSMDIEEEDVGHSEAPPPPPVRYSTLARILPHSLEAEEHLLSACLLDGDDVIERSIEAHIGPESFYDPKHGIIFGHIVRIYRSKKPVAIEVVAEELKASRELDKVGGYGFLAQVSSRVPTTAQANYFIEKVHEQALLRSVIRAGTGIVEDCYGFSGDIEQFVTERRSSLEQVFDGVAGAAALAESCRFDPSAPIVDSRVAYKLGRVIVSTAGNLTNIVSWPGAGKSGMIDAMLAAVMKDRDAEADCLGFEADNPEGFPVLHFDTEQSSADYTRLLHRSLRRSGRTQFPEWFFSYHLTGKNAVECPEIVRGVLVRTFRKFKRIFAVFIDGWGDLLIDPNDTAECFPFVAEMHAMAIKYDCPIIGVLHLNPGTEKARGHIGSQLERKCESVLQLEKDEETQVTAIYSVKKRGAPITKADGPRFGWDVDKAMHCTVGDWYERKAEKREERKAEKEERNPGGFRDKYSREEQVSFYPPSTGHSEGRAVIFRRAQEGSHISPASLDRLRREFLASGWIVMTGNGQYRRTYDGDLWANRKPAPTPTAELPGMRPIEEDVQL